MLGSNRFCWDQIDCKSINGPNDGHMSSCNQDNNESDNNSAWGWKKEKSRPHEQLRNSILKLSKPVINGKFVFTLM